MKCAICDKEAAVDSKLCNHCTIDRLAAASQARIIAGRGLNSENGEAYSEENWIKHKKGEDEMNKDEDDPFKDDDDEDEEDEEEDEDEEDEDIDDYMDDEEEYEDEDEEEEEEEEDDKEKKE